MAQSPIHQSDAQTHRLTPGSHFSTTDPYINRARLLEALEKHYEDLLNMALQNKLRRNETWKWLYDRGYREAPSKVIRFENPPEQGEDTVRVNRSYIILKIDTRTGLLQDVLIGKKPSEPMPEVDLRGPNEKES